MVTVSFSVLLQCFGGRGVNAVERGAVLAFFEVVASSQICPLFDFGCKVKKNPSDLQINFCKPDGFRYCG
jgi:hypothetical protein